MLKTAIIYQSPHHGNTRKLLEAIVTAHPEVSLIQAGDGSASLADFDVLGFASGIYAGKLHRKVRAAMESADGKGRKAFLLYTCGDPKGGKYGERAVETLRLKRFETLGTYFCVGLDSFGPLKLVGGVNKGRPNEEDIRERLRSLRA